MFCSSLFEPEHVDLERSVSPHSIALLVESALMTNTASADRRPVDPPPIVELKILEESNGETNDVTFAISANYFLFTTLEQARNVAQGRVPQDQSRLTVLTVDPCCRYWYAWIGTNPAGYFIFPDLFGTP